jgi:CubicO group peptidase (beta-lactamase class C family)
MKRSVFLFALVYSFALGSLAQELTNVPSNRASDELLKSKVDKLFAQWDRADSPGCALAIVKDGKIIYERGYGMANLENGIPITPMHKSVFDIASTSKQFTAAAVLLLSQQGKLSLDDNVRKYVPELPDFGTPITIRQLVYHTNGLRDNYYMLELAGWRWDDEIREEDVLALVSRQKELNHKPGAEHSYTNMGYSLLALIVKRASGQSLREFAEANIFKPLGMGDTQFRDDHTLVVKNRTASYEPRKDGGFSLSLGAVDTVGPNGVFTTIEDFARWD